MRGPTSYDDGYISRKLGALQTSPTFLPPVPSSYGRSIGGGYLQDYPPPPSRMTPRMVPPPNYYDYNEYGYGGYGGGYGAYGEYPRPIAPRMRYDAYLDDEYEVAPPVFAPRYSRATRLADAIVDAEKEKQLRRSPVRTTTTTTYTMPQFTHTRNVSNRMLQDEMEKMRIRLKGLSYSLDPNGPVPEIVMPDRSKRATSLEAAKRYSSGPKHLACVEYAGGVPQWKRKARASTRYPIEDPERLSQVYRDQYEEDLKSAAKDPERLILKDRLSLKIHTFLGDSMEPEKYERYLKTYRNPGLAPRDAQWREEYYKPKLYKASDGLSNTYSSKYPARSITGTSTSKWEEPDTIYSSTEKQPYSKTATGDDDDKKERRKKKKSKDREAVASESTTGIAAESLLAIGGDGSAAADADADPDMDDKEKKRLEKKKRKAEREAAATAAMEAELEALAAAEAELAMLESGVEAPAEAAAAPVADASEPVVEPLLAEPEPEVPQEKCELVSDVPEEEIPETSPTDEPQPSLPPVSDNVIDTQESNTLSNTTDALPEQEHTETTNLPLDTPLEPLNSLQEPVATEQTLVEEPVKAESDVIDQPIIEQISPPTASIGDNDTNTEQVTEPVVGESSTSEVDDQIKPEPEVQDQIADQSTTEEVPQTEQEYVEPPKKTFKADTDFDWGDMETGDTADTEAQQRGGTEGGIGESVGGVNDGELAISDDVTSDAPQEESQ